MKLRPVLATLILATLTFAASLAWAAPPTDLSLTTVSKNPDGTVLHTIKSYLRDGTKLRMEILSAQGKMEAVSVYRKDKGLVYGLEPDTRTYTQSELKDGDWERELFAVFPESGHKLQKTGEATVLKTPCEVFTSDLTTLTMTFTLAKGSGVILKSEWLQKGQVMQIDEATAFSLAKPALALFEIPAGYKRRPIVK